MHSSSCLCLPQALPAAAARLTPCLPRSCLIPSPALPYPIPPPCCRPRVCPTPRLARSATKQQRVLSDQGVIVEHNHNFKARPFPLAHPATEQHLATHGQ